MNLRNTTLGCLLTIPAALHAQNFYTQSYVTTTVNSLPFNQQLDYAGDADGGRGFVHAESSAAVANGQSRGMSSGDLATATLTAANQVNAPATGQRHYVASGSNMADTLTFARTGKDIVIPTRFSFSGILNGGIQSVVGDLVVYDDKNVPVFRMGVGLTQGQATQDAVWTIPATSSGVFNLTFQIGARLQVDAPGGAASARDLKLQFKWDLPSDVRYTSDSSVFNPERIHPVPEPASMLALGVGGIGLLNRRRRR